jgi:hypothetical protein
MFFPKFSTPLFTPLHDDNIFLKLLVLVECNVNAIKPMFHYIEFQIFEGFSKIKSFTNPQKINSTPHYSFYPQKKKKNKTYKLKVPFKIKN